MKLNIEKFLSDIEKLANDNKIRTSVFLLHKINHLKNKFIRQSPEKEHIVKNLFSDIKIKPLVSLKEDIKRKAVEYKKQKKFADEKTCGVAAQKIRKGSVIFVYGHSSRILNSLKTAKKEGTRFTVFTADSGNGPKGKKTLETVRNMGIPVKHHSDILIPNALEKSDILFFEPEGISSNRKIITSPGLTNVLETARKKNVTTYCVLNSFDIDKKEKNHNEEANEKHITAMINHKGIIRPSEFFRNSFF